MRGLFATRKRTREAAYGEGDGRGEVGKEEGMTKEGGEEGRRGGEKRGKEGWRGWGEGR
jgi:hypothetical protein